MKGGNINWCLRQDRNQNGVGVTRVKIIYRKEMFNVISVYAQQLWLRKRLWRFWLWKQAITRTLPFSPSVVTKTFMEILAMEPSCYSDTPVFANLPAYDTAATDTGARYESTLPSRWIIFGLKVDNFWLEFKPIIQKTSS